MLSSTLSSRGQTTLPEEVRNALNLQAGQKLVYTIHDNEVTITQHPGVMASFGSLTAKSKSWKKTRKLTRKNWANHASKEGTHL